MANAFTRVCCAYRSRRWMSIILEISSIVFAIFLMGFTTKSPTETFSWAKGNFSGLDLYLGLQEIQACNPYCRSVGYSTYPIIGDCEVAGRWVLACYILMIVFFIPPLFFLLNCGCIKPRWEKTITGICLFCCLVWSIVAIAQWYSVCFGARNVSNIGFSTGYAVGLAVIIIVFDFAALFVHTSTLFYNNKAAGGTEGATGGAGSLRDGYVASDAYSPSKDYQPPNAGNFNISHSGQQVGSGNMYAPPPPAAGGQKRAYGGW